MLMDSVDLSLLGEGPESPSLPDIMRLLEEIDRTPWAGRPRGPLRRNEGVPEPLETPLFLHRTELARVRARRNEGRATVLWFLMAGVVTTIVARLLTT